MILQLICSDRAGLVSELSGWVAANGGNIRHSDHHTDAGAGLFLSRIEWDLEDFGLPREAIPSAAIALAERMGGSAQIHFSDEIPRVAILASKQSHCLLDLLWRVRSGELPMEVPLVIANHPDLQTLCQEFGAGFECVPASASDKSESEARILALLKQHRVELAVLAKYMQVLSGNFLQQFPEVINIHHSFLPGFKGAKPYHQAHARGVKIIGATAHFVTEDLDEGPIIWQAVEQVDHPQTPDDLAAVGRDVESQVLARGLWAVLEDRVLLNGHRTIVFR